MKFASYFKVIQGMLYCYAKGENMLSVMISVCLAGVTRNTCHTSIYSILVSGGCVCKAFDHYTGYSTPSTATQALTPGFKNRKIQESEFMNSASYMTLDSGIQLQWLVILESELLNEISLKSIKKYLEFLFWFWYVQSVKSTQGGNRSNRSK